MLCLLLSRRWTEAFWGKARGGERVLEWQLVDWDFSQHCLQGWKLEHRAAGRTLGPFPRHFVRCFELFTAVTGDFDGH
jgi:hypothetical protein